MVDGRSQGKDGKRCSMRGPGGLKAEAGLRGPYGTSVRHTWPTLDPPLSLRSPSSLSLFLPSVSSRRGELSFLNLAQTFSYDLCTIYAFCFVSFIARSIYHTLNLSVILYEFIFIYFLHFKSHHLVEFNRFNRYQVT